MEDPRAESSASGNVPNREILERCSEMLLRASQGETTFKIARGQVAFARYNRTTESTEWVAICDPFYAVSNTYDEHGGGSGMLLRFQANRAGNPIEEISISKSALSDDSRKVISHLIDRGMGVILTRTNKERLTELLSLIRAEVDTVAVSRPGWHGTTFVSPAGTVHAGGNVAYRLHDSARLKGSTVAGSLDGWMRAVEAALRCGNADFLAMGLFSGYAGCIVNLLGERTSPILNFAGTTSRGKTTAQRFGASVWATPLKGGLLVQFNTTMNAMEFIAHHASGTVLAIDEGGQNGMSGQQYQQAIFHLAEGSGKRRMTSTGDERPTRTWLTCVTISEEIGFAAKVRRDGRAAAAGAVARCWEIDVDDAVHLDEETRAAIDGVLTNYGHAGPLFVDHLIAEGHHLDPERIRTRIADAERALLAADAAPQRKRVAGAAARIQVAGELAQETGLVPKWFDIAAAVKRVLERSLLRMQRDIDPLESALTALRESVVLRLGHDVLSIAHEEERVLREVVAYFGYPKGARQFEGGNPDSLADDRVYFIPLDRMAELGGGNVTGQAMAKALNEAGHLVKPAGNNLAWGTIPGRRSIRHYRVKGSFFHQQDDAADDHYDGDASSAAAA